MKELERRAELESHVKELDRRVSKLEESLKKQKAEHETKDA